MHSDDGKRAIGAIGVAAQAVRPLEGGSGGKPLAEGWGRIGGFNGAGDPKGPQESLLELKDPSWRL